MFSMPGGFEWIIIGLVVVLLFGAKKIPDLAKGLGRGIREFKDAQKEITDEIKNADTSVKDTKSWFLVSLSVF